jgi:cytochrome o ubiquinol oxidase subunit 1
MTTIETRPDDAVAADDDSPSAIEALTVGTYHWVTTTDHKRIGRLYAGFGLLVLAATAALGLLLGIERAGDSDAFIDADALLQMFQMYRIGIVFGGLVPLGLGLAVAVVPMQLGARSIAFPRAALTGFYTWLGGFSLAMIALARNGGMGGGDQHMVDLFLAGLGLMALGLMVTAGCVATSVLTTRAPGMTMRRVPLFAWASLIGALGMLIALPVMFGAIIYLFVDHRLAISANFGGTEGLGSWLGWAFSVPAVIVYALPGIGVAAELIPATFKTRQAMRPVKFAGIALVGVAAFAATTQQFVHDVTFDTDGESFIRGALPWLIFSGLPALGLMVALLLGLLTMKNGLASANPSVRAPFVFAFFGVLMIGIGIDANLILGITDLELVMPDLSLVTAFEEGATLLIVYGTVLSVIGGLIFWAPKLWGRVLPDKQLIPLSLLGLIGTVLAGGSMLLAGFLDQVGGVPSSDLDVQALLSLDQVDGGVMLNTLALIGHGLMILTVVAFVLVLIGAWFGTSESDIDDNPYGGQTAEWGTASPAPAHNFDDVVTVASAEPQLDLTHEGSQS